MIIDDFFVMLLFSFVLLLIRADLDTLDLGSIRINCQKKLICKFKLEQMSSSI